jgi:hypothetical protein
MAGRVVVSTLNNDTGVLATQNGMTGIAKAWVNFNGTGTVAIRDSFNVSSITDNGTGDYTINFTTAMPNVNYTYSFGLGNGTSAPTGAVWGFGSFSTATYLTTSLRLNAVFSSIGGSGSFDPNPATVTIFSS